jgi:hypothetical protein
LVTVRWYLFLYYNVQSFFIQSIIHANNTSLIHPTFLSIFPQLYYRYYYNHSPVGINVWIYGELHLFPNHLYVPNGSTFTMDWNSNHDCIHVDCGVHGQLSASGSIIFSRFDPYFHWIRPFIWMGTLSSSIPSIYYWLVFSTSLFFTQQSAVFHIPISRWSKSDTR